MTGGRAWDIAKDNLGRCPIFLFFPVKKKKKGTLQLWGELEEREWIWKYQASFITTYDRCTRNMETRKRDKKNEEMIGKYALHFFFSDKNGCNSHWYNTIN